KRPQPPLRSLSQRINGRTDTALGNPPVRLAKRHISRITRSETSPAGVAPAWHLRGEWRIKMPALKNPRHEAFAQALARGMSASAAYVEAGYKANRHNAAALAREEHIRTRVAELQEEQLAIHQQATAAAAANKQVTIESLIAEAEAARAKAMSEKGGAAAAVSALTAKAKLAGMWREKLDQHNTGTGTVSTVWSVTWDEEGEQSD